MNTFRKYTIALMLGILCVGSSLSLANITAVQGSSSKKTLVANSGNTVPISWRVSVTVGHATGAFSTNAEIIDPSTSAILLPAIGGPLNQPGNGPFNFAETLSVSSGTVQGWLQSGIQRVVVRRQFNDVTGSNASGFIVLAVSESGLAAVRDGASELAIQRLRISFDDDQSAMKLIAEGGALQPYLTVNYAGTGVLEGRWQVAEPGSTEGLPMYRTLSMVRQPLLKAQESKLAGPVLPTNRVGKYLLRFCVNGIDAQDVVSPTGDAACPDAAQLVETAYQVMPEERPAAVLDVLSPANQQSVDNTTSFSWPPVANAALYKLDVFQVSGDQQWFVTGILLPSANTATALSQLMQQKLNAGGVYRWQVSAVNAQGVVLAKSAERTFQYQP